MLHPDMMKHKEKTTNVRSKIREIRHLRMTVCSVEVVEEACPNCLGLLILLTSLYQQ